MIVTGAGIDSITTGIGNDTITARGGNDVINAEIGGDTINYVTGPTGTNDGADTIDGGANNDILAITGTGGNDALTVVLTGSTITSINGGTVTNVESVTLALGTGTDTLDYTTTSSTVIANLAAQTATAFTSVSGLDNVTGGSGNDSLTGSASANALLGAGGDDLLIVNVGDAGAGDTYDGGANTDTLRVTGNANFTGATLQNIEALTFQGSGTTTVTLTSSHIGGTNLSANLVVTGDAQANHVVVNGAADLSGWVFNNWTPGVDTITLVGTGAGEILIGSGENDTIQGQGGDDTIDAFDGEDTVVYNFGDGRDIVDGGNQDDADTLQVNGTGSAETFNVNLFDLSGNDRIGVNIVAGTNQIAAADASNYEIAATAIEELDIDAGGGNDTVVIGGNLVAAGLAVNTVTVILGQGNDNVIVQPTTGTAYGILIEGGEGNDVVNAAGVTQLITFNGGIGDDTAIGGAGADVLSGDEDNDTLTGGGGLDEIYGGDGDDYLNVSAGDVVADEIYDGGADDDELYVSGTGSVNFTGTTLTSIETLGFGSIPTGLEVVFTSDQIGGTALSSTLEVEADSADNSIVINMVSPFTLDISGWTFTDWGVGGTDTVTINGSASADTITGSDVNDIVNLATGGNDTVVLAPGSGDDTINGFTAGAGANDVIDLRPLNRFYSLSDVLARATDSGSNTTIQLGGGNTVTLNGVLEGNFNADDFLFSTNTPPVLADVATSVTFVENTVNATPQLIDSSVTFTDAEGNFPDGTLTVSGLVAGQDVVSIRNQGTGAGQIRILGRHRHLWRSHYRHSDGRERQHADRHVQRRRYFGGGRCADREPDLSEHVRHADGDTDPDHRSDRQRGREHVRGGGCERHRPERPAREHGRRRRQRRGRHEHCPDRHFGVRSGGKSGDAGDHGPFQRRARDAHGPRRWPCRPHRRVRHHRWWPGHERHHHHGDTEPD